VVALGLNVEQVTDLVYIHTDYSAGLPSALRMIAAKHDVDEVVGAYSVRQHIGEFQGSSNSKQFAIKEILAHANWFGEDLERDAMSVAETLVELYEAANEVFERNDENGYGISMYPDDVLRQIRKISKQHGERDPHICVQLMRGVYVPKS
jgi:hypothetical protein